MNQEGLDRIKDLALYLERFRELEPQEQSWIKELLKNGKLVLSCLEILEEIEKKTLNYYELADIVGCVPETAKQKLNAMIAGGMSINHERDGRFVAPLKGGRPRRLARKAVK